MPRRLLIRTSDFPYHVTNRSNNRDFFYLPMEELWDIFMSCFAELTAQFHCQIHAFVLMSNHYHLLISTPNVNIGDAMKYLHREVARMANRKSHRINHFFGGRYKWSVIGQENYYWNAIKYIFQNPVRAGICGSVYEYKYSSLNSFFPNHEWMLTDFFHDPKKKIALDPQWLDQPFKSDEEILMRSSLRRTEFKPPKDSNGFLTKIDMPLPEKGTVTSR